MSVSYGQAQIKEYEIDYSPLASSGVLPEIYTKSATEKANRDIQKLKKEKNHLNKNAKEKFFIQANFQLDQILRSGKILFNDPVSQYVNKVADETFKSNPELRKQVQVFVIKDDIVNAFSFDNGLILVSIGLLAQLDNEAQLSYILCHEASHYLKKHSIESYIEYTSKKNRYSTSDLLSKYKFSQSHELEADVEGIKLFKKTNYSYKGVAGSFNVLKYSYLPFDEMKFEKSFFEDSNLVFPPDFYLKDLNKIKKEEDYDDSKSTHPNIKKRKDAVSSELGEFSDEGRMKFIVDQNEFYKTRENARFELCRIELLNREYADCIYDCYLLSKKYPNNIYLKTTIGKALYQIAADKSPVLQTYKKTIRPNIDITGNQSVSYNYADKEGNSGQVYYLLDKLSGVNGTILALNYNWKLNKELNYQNSLVSNLCDSLFILLSLNNEIGVSHHSKLTRQEYIKNISSPPTAIKDSTTIDSIPKKKKLNSLDELEAGDLDSRTSRIQAQKVENEIKELKKNVQSDSTRKSVLETDFETFAFAELLRSDNFIKKYHYYDSISRRFRTYTNQESTNLTGNTSKKNKSKELDGMGINKIIILDPFYMKFDERFADKSENQVKYFASDERLDQFGNILRENATIAQLEYEYIDSKSLKAEDVDKYNDYTVFNDWMSEYLSHSYNLNMLVLNNDAAKRTKEKYSTRFVLMTGVINVRMKKENVPLLLLGSVIPYTAPFCIPQLLRKEQHTIYMAVLFDLETNKIVYYDTVSMRLTDSPDFLNAFVYDTMLTIKQEPKK